MDATKIIQAAIPLAEAAMQAIAAANAGNPDEAAEHLRNARRIFDEGSAAWDEAGEAKDGA